MGRVPTVDFHWCIPINRIWDVTSVGAICVERRSVTCLAVTGVFAKGTRGRMRSDGELHGSRMVPSKAYRSKVQPVKCRLACIYVRWYMA